MSDNNTSDAAQISKFRELALRGANYREHKEFDLYGDTLEIPLKPLIDDDYYGLLFSIDVDEDQVEEAMENAEDPETGEVDPNDLDADMVTMIQEAACMGIDHEAMGETEEGVREIVTQILVGGKSLEIGSEVIELSDAMGEAEKFRR